MPVSIRYATKDDAILIADLSRQTFFDTFKEENTGANMDKFLNEQFTRGRLIMEVGAPNNIFLLAYDNDEVAGYVKLREDRAPNSLGSQNALEIARLYAVKEKLGKGVGRIMMENSLRIAREKKKDFAWLGVWEHNHRAINFYKSWGFIKFDETDFLLGDDVQRDWLMKLAL